MSAIFHIATADEWRTAQDAGRYEVESLRAEGFIHCSTRQQVLVVANARFVGRNDLVLLRIEEERVEADIRYEQADLGIFPHVYGPLNLDAVAAVIPFVPGLDGKFSLPSEA